MKDIFIRRTPLQAIVVSASENKFTGMLTIQKVRPAKGTDANIGAADKLVGQHFIGQRTLAERARQLMRVGNELPRPGKKLRQIMSQ